MNILNVCPGPVYPPISGGTLRVHYLNLIAANYGNNVYLFTQDVRNINEIKKMNFIKKISINNNYTEYRYINIFSLMVNYITVSLGVAKIFTGNILDIFKPEILYKLMKKCDIIKVENPWQFNHIFYKKPDDIPIVLVEHNAEFDRFMSFKDPLFLKPIKKLLINIAIEKEKFAVENADIIFTVSEVDKNKLIKKYRVKKSKFYVIPNGVDISRFTTPTPMEKDRYKCRIIGDSSKKVILFVGSLYYPNIEAVKFIINKIAPEVLKHYKNCLFLIVGSVGNYFKNISLNKNIKNIIITGKVRDVIPYFKIADIAINPIISGSGTNIKLLEYLASGIPTVTTSFGMRGIEVEPNKHVIVEDIEDFSEGILELLSDEDTQRRLSINGRKLVEEKYDWEKISKEELRILNQVCNMNK
ncbi:glycosyltransferase family 4 protein [Methanothermococcus sp. SCGC AD-155-N22]|nr:glycosyltransferase family 4 protein [Methanothermococcus sp. SCGC AD-155-N22]